ncbi:chymotrypsin BI-like [Lepeophtheirus salmonis]|nr:chymotrypsin BI-like [Lepeophtheirus salmonis]XP_040583576.1 chymotrypsin BI-like [Lepeophtheirus salmonis]XP_040583577.1 chymotrypsin BI-like [Lepeophtheirus salmonis]
MRALVLLTIIGSVLANPKYPDICGLENKPSVDSKIIGGHEAARHQFPWLAFVTTGGYCTGSVLDENWIITAKHCVLNDNWSEIRVGIHSTGNGADEPYKQTRTSTEFYESPTGDFALIKLEIPLELNEYVRPVCLPSRADANRTFVGASTTITGWGVNNFERANYPELYFAKNVNIIQCGFEDNIICSDANQGMAVCFGDSGGPLNYEMEDGKYMQIGVNQFITNGKCVGGVNGYARVSTHLDFIQEITGMVIE